MRQERSPMSSFHNEVLLSSSQVFEEQISGWTPEQKAGAPSGVGGYVSPALGWDRTSPSPRAGR